MKQIEHKSPYRVPSMSEIAATPWNGLTVASTFSGCGGSCLGYRMAGFKVAWANEFVPAAQESYRANAPETILDCRDIRTIQPHEILDAIKMQPGQLDLFDGSPPCAAFSTAGKREKAWNQVRSYSDTKQRVDDLFFEYARLLQGLQPKVFVAENVSGLVKGTAKGYFLEILKELKVCGYRVSCRVLDAQWLGVPQQRQRVIFIGVREDLPGEPVHPGPLPYRYSVRDALPWIESIRFDPHGQFGIVDNDGSNPMPCITASNGAHIQIESANGYSGHAGMSLDIPMATVQASRPVSLLRQEVEPETNIDGYAIGTEYDKLAQGEQSGKYFSLMRSSEALPSPCIQASHGNTSTAGVTHPTEKRKFTIAELKRICAFPDDFILTGSYAQQWERLGRAVPPVMMSHVAACVRDNILGKICADSLA